MQEGEKIVHVYVLDANFGSKCSSDATELEVKDPGSQCPYCGKELEIEDIMPLATDSSAE